MGAKGTILKVDIDTESKNILGASQDTKIHVWSIENQQLIVFFIKSLLLLQHSFNGHKNPVNSAKFFDVGKKVASGSFDGIIQIWDMGSTEC